MRIFKIIILTFSLIFSCTVLSRQKSDHITLASGGKPLCRIVISHSAGGSEMKAAEELQKYIGKISGAVMPITREDAEPGPTIWIGSAGRNAGCPDRIDWEKLDDDGFTIKTGRNKLVIAGGRDKGALYGVYTLLETYLGCRKYSPEVEIIPKKETITLSGINDTQIPKIKFRDAYFYDSAYSEWHKLDDHSDLFGLYVHTFRTLIPPETYFKDHPEYFSKVKSGRIPDGQLCLTNPDVFRIIVGKLDSLMKQKPERRYWSVSQNDTFNPCDCDSCRAVNLREGSPSGSLLAFVNSIADEFPDKVISTLAYQYSRSAPKSIIPRKNVNIMLCSIECNRSRPISSDPGSASFVRDLTDWSILTDNIYIWDYVVDFRNYHCPFPNLRVLGPNIRYFAENGIKYIFEQGSGRSKSEFKELRTYLIAKLLWNPGIETDSVIDDFVSGYYGRAAPFIRKYIGEMHASLESSGEELWIYGYPLPSRDGYLSGAMLDRYVALFDSAERSVSNDTILLKRVRAARLPLQFTLVEQAKVYGTSERGFFGVDESGTRTVRDEMKEMLEIFVERCKEFGYEAMEEMGTTPAQYYASTLDFLEKSRKSHMALNKEVQLRIPASPKYRGGEATALTDGMRGWEDYHMHWLGFEGEDMEATVDLGSAKNTRRISADFLQDINSWIFLPSKVVYYISADGNSFKKIAEIKNTIERRKNGAFINSFSAEFESLPARYIRVTALNMKNCPAWHKGAGGPAWIFTDEIVVE